MATKRLRQKRSQQFYEALPGAYMDSYQLFPPAQRYTEDVQQKPQEAAVPSKIRRRIIRQGLLLLGLLAVQIILFIVLLHSTLNLG